MQQQVTAIILAAGKSSRLGGINKIWHPLKGKPVLAYSIEAFANHPRISNGVVVAQEGDRHRISQLLPPNWQMAIGGSERAFSVKAGLTVAAAANPGFVLIHDAARPFVLPHVIDALIATLEAGADAAIPALAVTDSLKAVENGFVSKRIPREGAYRIQTPQGFPYPLIKACHDADHAGDATDDSTLIENCGKQVTIIEGDPLSDKITTAGDLSKAEMIARGMAEQNCAPTMEAIPRESHPRESRIAIGFDTHRFIEKKGTLMLGGVAIDHDRILTAHSDGDVLLHALTDAIYGLTADGDIGTHFPPSDEQWRGVDSAVFLKAAVSKLQTIGGALSFIDLTVIAEKPKITPHRQKIRQRIADITGLTITRISLKATTTEGLGFTGRQEGIAAQAAVTALMPVEDHKENNNEA